METLHLNIQKKYFDMILSGIKKEEYREITEYWKKRFNTVKRLGINNITFSNGYSKDRRQMVIEIKYISIRQGLEEWGAEKGKVYIVSHLGNILLTKNCKMSDNKNLNDNRVQASIANNRYISILVGDYVFEFSSFTQWVNKAQGWFKSLHLRGDDVVCIDAKGRLCRIGREFMRARDDNSFPIKVYKYTNYKN